MTQRRALEATTAESDVPEALLELALGLADAVDLDPGNASLWREYRAAVDSVMEVVNGSPDDSVAAFRLAIVTPDVPTEIRHSAKS